MSIELYLNHSDLQAETTRAVLRNQIAAYEELQTSLNQFVLASPTLSDKTYDSAKAYSSQILLPLIRACILYDEAVIVATEELPARYREEVDVIDLKEWELLDYMDRADSLIERYRELIRQESWKDLPNYDYLNNLSQTITNYENTKSLLEAKLQKLMEFNWSSANIFNHVHDLYYAVQEGMRQAKSSWNGESQTFTLPPQEKMTWATDTNARWTERKTSLHQNYHSVLKKVRNGENLTEVDLIKLYTYCQNENSNQLPKEITIALKNQWNTNEDTIQSAWAEFLLLINRKEEQDFMKAFVSTFSDKISSLGTVIDATTGTIQAISYYGTKAGPVGNNSFVMGTSSQIQQIGIISKHLDDIGKITKSLVSVSFALGIVDDLLNDDKTVGQAIVHNGTSFAVGWGAGMVGATAGTAMAGQAVAAGLLASNPVGWGIAIGIGIGITAGLLFEEAYDSNFLGLQDGLDTVGEAIDGFGTYLRNDFLKPDIPLW